MARTTRAQLVTADARIACKFLLTMKQFFFNALPIFASDPFFLQSWNCKFKLSMLPLPSPQRQSMFEATPSLLACRTFPTMSERSPVMESTEALPSPSQWCRFCPGMTSGLYIQSSQKVKHGKILKNSSTILTWWPPPLARMSVST